MVPYQQPQNFPHRLLFLVHLARRILLVQLLQLLLILALYLIRCLSSLRSFTLHLLRALDCHRLQVREDMLVRMASLVQRLSWG
jgi:hypothetical protein